MATFNTINKTLAMAIYKFIDNLGEDRYMAIRKEAFNNDMRVEDYISDKAVKAKAITLEDIEAIF